MGEEKRIGDVDDDDLLLWYVDLNNQRSKRGTSNDEVWQALESYKQWPLVSLTGSLVGGGDRLSGS